MLLYSRSEQENAAILFTLKYQRHFKGRTGRTGMGELSPRVSIW